MILRAKQGNQETNNRVITSATDAVEADDVLFAQCEKWFSGLPAEPNGIVLSKQGALRATHAAAAHFRKETARLACQKGNAKADQE